jgi:hypothetical protein
MARIELRISNEDKEKLKEKAAAAGYKSVSKYIRDCALGKKITARVDIDAVYNLRKVGNNLNQIARQINTEKKDETLFALKSDIEALIWNISDVIRKIIHST